MGGGGEGAAAADVRLNEGGGEMQPQECKCI